MKNSDTQNEPWLEFTTKCFLIYFLVTVIAGLSVMTFIGFSPTYKNPQHIVLPLAVVGSNLLLMGVLHIIYVAKGKIPPDAYGL